MDKKQIKYTSFHLHLESRYDSSMGAKKTVKKLHDYGAKAMVVTDHGVMSAIEEARDAIDSFDQEQRELAKKRGEVYLGEKLKLIPGIEAYFEEDDDLTHRKHLIMVAKDIVGYHELSKVASESYKRMDSRGFPRVNTDLLERFFSEGKPGHGHVIASSACMQGILASILLTNSYIEKDMKNIKEKMSKLCSPEDASYLKNVENLKATDEEIASLTEEVKTLQTIAKKPFKKKENTLKSLEGKPEYEEFKAALDAEKAETEAAKKKIEENKSSLTKLKIKRKKVKDICDSEAKDHAKWNILNAELKKLQNGLSSEDKLYEEAKEEALKFQKIFGKGNFYCELQNHRIPQEIYVMPLIAKIAKELGIPVVAANDAHMVTNSEEEIKTRQILRSLRFNQWETVDESDKELYIKTDDELKSILSEILDEEIVDEALENVGKIVDSCYIDFSADTHYPKFKSRIEGEDAKAYLARLANEGIEWRYPNREGWTEEHQQRMEYELEVIDKLGVNDYLCIVQDFLEYGRLLGKLDPENPDERYLADPYNVDLLKEITKDKIGASIGPGRGSAVGSLVSYLIGITGIDPIEHELLFERFLNVERVTMPDIDSDFRPDIRNKVLDYVKHLYGEKAVCCISTKGRQKARAAVRNCARLLGSELYDDTTRFLALGDEICKSIPKELDITLDDCWDDLVNKYKENSNALTILNNAKLVEGTFLNVGMHAAGVIIADNGRVGDYVPLMYNKDKEQWMTQCDKDYCENLGLLKMDFLGLKNLGIIDNSIRLIYSRTGKKIDIERVPFEPDVFKNIFSKGETNSIFQFESNGMKSMLKQFKPENIDDIILLVAAYRPGPMQFLDDIIAVKHGRKKPEYVIPEMAEVLGKTYGYPVYQEQIMTIFNKFAGFTLGESDIIRRYMSKKKTDKFMAYKNKFVNGMIARGGNPEAVETFWNQLVDFSKYAFNKSHAAAYAYVAYYTAWLKLYYPKEYLCSVMNTADFDKLSGLIKDCRNYNIDVLPVNINESAEKFSIINDSIVYGLSVIKNVGDASNAIITERNANGKFASFADFMIRTKCRKDVAESLIKAGAFDAFTDNRGALVSAVKTYLDLIKKVNDKQASIESFKLKLAESEKDSKEYKKAETSLIKAESALKEHQDNLQNISVDIYGEENLKERLIAESEMAGAFVSGTLLDSYKDARSLNCTPIVELSKSKKVSVMGFISGLEIRKRKSDGAPMAFFTLEDNTGNVAVSCFADAYAKNNSLIEEGLVVKIEGRCDEDVDSFTDETILKLTVQKIEELKPSKEPIFISVRNMPDWADNVYNRVKPYFSKNGHPLYIHDLMTGQIRKTKFFVGKDILSNKINIKAYMSN